MQTFDHTFKDNGGVGGWLYNMQDNMLQNIYKYDSSDYIKAKEISIVIP